MACRENIRNDLLCSVVHDSHQFLYLNACLISSIYIIADKTHITFLFTFG